MNEIPLEFYVSPINKQPLILKSETILTDEDGNEFHKNIENGFWNFVPEYSPLYSKEECDQWKKVIDNFLVSFEEDPEHNVSYAERDDALAFGEFCNYHGMVLDLGCGPHKVPSYLKYRRNPDADHYGLDPVIGEQPREYKFVQGVGEHVPFKEGLFDVTIYATSLLHFLDPRVGIKEALRVTKPDGYLSVWVGEKTKQEIEQPVVSNQWYDDLEVPEGAENPFHFKRFGADDFEGYINDCNLKIIEKEETEIEGWGKNIFYKVVH